jgi:hypothetical protein
VRAGNAERGLGLIEQAVEVKPTATEIHDRLILSLVWLGRIEEAGAAAEVKLGAIEKPEALAFLRAASLWAKVENWARAAAVLRLGLRIYPGDLTLGHGLGEIVRAADMPHFATTVKSAR